MPDAEKGLKSLGVGEVGGSKIEKMLKTKGFYFFFFSVELRSCVKVEVAVPGSRP